MDDARRYPAMSSSESEERFRQIFLAHLVSDGYPEADAYRLIFKTPDRFHEPPSTGHGMSLLDDFRRSYQRELALCWFFAGLNRKSTLDARFLEPPLNPPTFVVFAGFFGEFNAQLPFQPLVTDVTTRFHRKWQAAIEKVEDQVYSLRDLSDQPCRLADVVRIGSIDAGERSYANVIVFKSPGGSLETFGTLASNATTYARRLEKLFNVIDEDSDVYLVGYSRGLAVALELIAEVHQQSRSGAITPAARRWFEKLRGVVGLGGVYYGSNFAHDVLTGRAGAASDLIQWIVDTSNRLEPVPAGASAAKRVDIVRRNTRTWAALVEHIARAGTLKIAAGKTFVGIDLARAVVEEGKTRLRQRELPIPNPLGIFVLVNSFLLETFRVGTFVSRYNENILGFKQLVEAVVAGVSSLTPESRDAWWRSHELPKDLVLLSITGTMPDVYLGGIGSPLADFEGFGTRTSDYNISLRASYYDVVASEDTLINDSQLSHFCSRYWEQMYPEHRYAHYYLGVLGTHHWGMAFSYAIQDRARVGVNAFPRETLLKSIASFTSSLKEM